MTDNEGEMVRPGRSAPFWFALAACLVAFAFAVLVVIVVHNDPASTRRQQELLDQNKALIEQNKTISIQLDEQVKRNDQIAAQMDANRQEDSDRAECVRRYEQRTDNLRWAYVSTLGDVLVTFATFIHGDPSQIAQVQNDVDAVAAANAAADAAAAAEAAYTAQQPLVLPCPLAA